MIFVTGGTGLLGNCLVRELVSRGVPVRALCRPGTSRECFEGLQLEIVEGDLGNQALLQSAMSGCHAVIHSAAMIHVGWQRLEESREINVEGTRRIVAACLATGARLLYVSTVDTLPTATSIDAPIDESGNGGVPNTQCTYVVSKTEAEQVVRQAIEQSALDAMIFHPGFMLAPYDWKPSSGRMMLEVARAPIPAAPSGGCSACDARDVAAAMVNALDRGTSGQAYILAGENMSYSDLWTRMLQVAGRSKRAASRPIFMRVSAKLLDTVLPLLPIREGDINGATIAMGQLYHYYDSSKAERELGYTRRPLADTLQDAWQWLQQRARSPK